MNIHEQIKMYEEKLTDELRICNRIAFYHQNSKDTISALKVKIKELKEKVKND